MNTKTNINPNTFRKSRLNFIIQALNHVGPEPKGIVRYILSNLKETELDPVLKYTEFYLSPLNTTTDHSQALIAFKALGEDKPLQPTVDITKATKEVLKQVVREDSFNEAISILQSTIGGEGYPGDVATLCFSGFKRREDGAVIAWDNKWNRPRLLKVYLEAEQTHSKLN